MRIGIDGSCLANRRGFGRFARQTIAALAESPSDHQFVVFVDGPSSPGVQVPDRFERVVVVVDEAPTRAASASGRRRMRDMLAMGKAVARSGIDLIYFPATYSFFPVWNVKRVVVTMHDTLAMAHPELVFPTWQGRVSWSIKEHAAARWADLILTVSESARRDLIDWFRVPADKVRVVTEGPDAVFGPRDDGPESRVALERHGIAPGSRFVLYVGGLSPHKNLVRLIEAFARGAPDDVTLVLVGDLGDVFHTHVPELRAAVARSGLRGRVIFTGFVPDADLVFLYNRAYVLAQPSLMEGFGLPPVEAMACGTPVLSSLAGSLPEVVGDAGLFFDPTDVSQIAHALHLLLGDPAERNRLARHAIERAGRFTWSASARAMLACFDALEPGANTIPNREEVGMKFCMLTTFFGSHSFGGDAAFVDRLSRTLARHGHEVHVIHCRDAFDISRGDQTPRPYEPPPGVVIHPLESPFGGLSPLATHQTGFPMFKARAINRLLRAIRPDVLHFHNLSLIGGPGLLGLSAPGAVKLMTTHEHWLVCPLHVLWKHDQGVCETRECVRCCLQARRPPQLWRPTRLMERKLRHLDTLICPSHSTMREHARRGIKAPMTHLPYFLPPDYTGLPDAPVPSHPRPYVAAAGRLEKIKGFQDVIDVMHRLPGLDLRIAGSGQYESVLRDRARGLDNVHFEGRLDAARVAALFRGARAVVVPSLVYETFGYVVLEAFAERTPVIVRNLGALPELVEESQGGLVFDAPETLVAWLGRLATDNELRDSLGENGLRARHDVWSEAEHLRRYYALIDKHRHARHPARPARNAPPRIGRTAPSPIRPAQPALRKTP